MSVIDDLAPTTESVTERPPVTNKRTRASSDWLAAGAITLCTAVPMLAGRQDAIALAATLIVAVLAITWARSVSHRMRGLQAQLLECTDARTTAESQNLCGLLRVVVPVWRTHVESIRSQTDEAVGDLVTSFASITDRFEAAGFKGTGLGQVDSKDLSFSLLTLCERELQPVIVAMNAITDSKGILATRVDDLARATGELQGMAANVDSIAAQTNILAINAAIEAARAGDVGRGFGVIAKEIRSLSQVSAATAKQMSDRMEEITVIMKATSHAAVLAASEDSRAIELSGTVVKDVLTHVRQLSDDSQTMLESGNVIRTDIERLIMSLQFQDRVSQVIGVVDTDMSRLVDTVDSGLPPPDAANWLSELESHYTMREQRVSHNSVTADEASTSEAGSGAAVLFF
jgi:methyl-accepting chemotaxis protein